MITAQALAACLLTAANTYQVPPAIMIGIMQVEGGHVGQAVGPNMNGTYDLGPMQVNTRWVPQLAHLWHVSTPIAYQWVRDDGCVNVNVAAWILKQKLTESRGNLYTGIAHYHSATPSEGYPYARRVIVALERKGLVQHDGPPTSHVYTYAQR